jgi:hypothetical protein
VESDTVDANLRVSAVRAEAPSGSTEPAAPVVGVEDSVTLRGLFDSTCLQLLIGMLIACAAAHKHKEISAIALKERRDQSDMEEEFIDRSWLEQASLLPSKQTSAAPSALTSQIAVIRNPFELEIEEEMLIPEQILKESPEDHPDRLYFYITASDPVGVSYHQPVKKKRKMQRDAMNSAASSSETGDRVRSFTSKVIYWSNDLLPGEEEGTSGRLTNESSQARREDCSRLVSQTALEVTVEQRAASSLLSAADLARLHQRVSDAARGATVLPALKEY